MPANKSALIRYRIIDKCLTNPYRTFPSWEDLKEKIEEQIDDSISKSMIDKDIAAMKKIYNAPIQYDRLRKGYQYTEKGFSIQSFPLTYEEIEALDFSTALLYQFKETKLFYQFENAINKVIEGYRISKDLGIAEHKLLQVEEPVKSMGSQWIEPALKAIINSKVLSLEYQSFGKEKKQHHFSPYLLKEYRNRWYLIGHSDKINKVIVLALDRIIELHETEHESVKSPGFDPEEFFKYSFGITQIHDVQPEKVILSFTSYQAPYILSQPLHKSQNLLSEKVDDIRIELTVYITSELVMSILSYGKEVKVIEPESLKNQIINTIREISNHYESISEKSFNDK